MKHIPLQTFSICVLLISFAACSGRSNSPMPPQGPLPQSPQSAGALMETIEAPPAKAPALRFLQVFDFRMTSSQATATAKEISYLWGGGSGSRGATPLLWQAANPSLVDILYFYQGTDDPRLSGHTLSWFMTHHSNWVVYDCDAKNRPTKTVAYQPGLGAAVPLDISNPDVIDYQIHVAADAAIRSGNNAIGSDQTVFFDFDGGQQPGWFGCGIYAGPNFTNFQRRWGYRGAGFPNDDPKWASDTAAWVKTAKYILTTDVVLAPHHLKLAINHPLGNPADPKESVLMKNADMELDEVGFADYGKYTREPWLLSDTLSYMTFVQSRGSAFLIVDKFGTNSHGTPPTAGITNDELTWAIATDLLGTQGRSAFYVTHGPYGVPSYFPSYATVNSRIGSACGAYARNASGHVFYRRYTHGLVLANDGGAGRERFTLPNHTYVDLMGAAIRNPLSIGASKAFVLFTTADGCT